MSTVRTVMSTERTQMYRDILTTAIEGGIDYWAHIVSVSRYVPDVSDAIALIKIKRGAEPRIIDTESIRKAMVILNKGGGYSTRPEVEAPDWWKRKWRRAYQDCADGSWDFDASDADTVVQVACFGEVVYG